MVQNKTPAAPTAIIPLLSHQKQVVESKKPYLWANWARQAGGKSFTFSLRRVLRGLVRRRNQLFMSAGERQVKELMEATANHLKAIKVACEYETNESVINGEKVTTVEIKIPGRFKILGIPANPDTARGFTGDVLLDEFSIHQRDRAIWAAMLPTITRGQGEIDVCSTPRGKRKMFYELRNNPRFEKSTVTIHDAIRNGLEVDAQAMQELCNDEDIWRQEFLCEFIDGATDFLKYDDIEGCVHTGLPLVRTPRSLSAHPDPMYLGIDIGRRKDLTVMWVLTAHGSGFRTLSVFVLEQTPFRSQYELLKELMNLPKMSHVCIDETGIGMQMAEDAQEDFGKHRVTKVYFSNKQKNNMGSALKLLIDAHEIQIPDDEGVLNDFRSIEKTVTGKGEVSLTAGTGTDGHADRFWAAALARMAAKVASPVKIAIASAKPRPQNNGVRLARRRAL